MEMNTAMQNMAGSRGGAPGPPQQQVGMQRNGAVQQIQKRIFQSLQQEEEAVGWRREITLGRRTMYIFQLVSHLRLVKMELSVPNIIGVATNFERKIYTESIDKNDYEARCRARLGEITSMRMKQAATLQQQMQDSNGSQMQMFPQTMPGSNGMPMQMPGQFQQGFPNLQMQLPMQPSPVPVHQIHMQQPQSGPMNNSMLGGQQPVQHTQQTLQNVPRQRPQGPSFTAEDNQKIHEIAQKLAQNANKDEVETIKQRIQSMPVEQRQNWVRQGLDPLAFYFRSVAINHFKNDLSRTQGNAAGQQSQGPVFQGNGFNPPQTQPISRNPSNTQGKPFGPMTATPNFEQSFAGNIHQNMHQIRNAQQEAIRSQELGQVVVPASSGQRAVQQQQQQQQQQPQLPQPSRGVMQVTPHQPSNHPSNQARSTTTPSNAQQQHLQAQQHQKEKIQQAARMQPQVKIAMGAQGQLPQQAPLQGQIGGLTSQIGQGPPQQSPAMPNLNRPLETSLQQPQVHGKPQAQGNPQSHPQQRTPQNQAQNFDASLSQQSLTKQQPQSTANPTDQLTMGQRMSRMVQNLPESTRQHFSSLPEAERRSFLASLLQKAQQAQEQQLFQNLRPTMAPDSASIPGQSLPPGLQQQSHAQRFSQGPFRQPQSSQISPQVGNQQHLSAGISHPYVGQLQGQMQQMMPSQQPIQNRPLQMNTTLLTEDQARLMDLEDFPPTMLTSQAVLKHMPQEVKKWGQLKSWVAQNMHVVPVNIAEKLKGLQSLHFQTLVNRRSKAQQTANQNIQSSNPAPQQGPAPPAQMVQMPNQQQSATGQNLMQMSRNGRLPPMQHPSLQELQATRLKLPEHMRGMPDDQLRNFLMQKRHQQMVQAAQNQQNHNMTQMQLTNMQEALHQQAQSRMLQMHANQSSQAQNHPQINQQTNQQPAAILQNVRNVGGQANAKGAVHGQTVRQAPQGVNQLQTPHKGLKRSNTDDVIEVPNPNIMAQLQEQRMQNIQGKQVQTKQKPGTPQNAHDQAVSALQPARTRYESELRKQAAQGDQGCMQQISQTTKPGPMQMNIGRPNGEEDSKKQRLMQIVQEVIRAPDTRKPVPMDRQTREKMVNQLKENTKMISRMEQSITIFFHLNGNETLTRELLGTRIMLIKQYRDKEFNPVDQLTIGPEELDSAITKLKKVFNYVMQNLAEQKKSQNTKNSIANNNVSQSPAVPTAQVSMTPLNAANLQQNQQAELQVLQAQRQTLIQRNNSNRDNRAPAAPTSSQPPFSFGAQSPSPHGVPQYNFPNGLTQDMLALPRTKKRKTNEANSTVTTPAQMHGTPGPTGLSQMKVPSPQIRRPSAPSTKIKCPVVDCALTKQDFATVEDLAKHTMKAHQVKEPIIEDPLSYALESIRFGLGIDENGKVKPSASNQKDENMELGSHGMKISTSRQGQTPFRQEGSTPMSRVPTQNGSPDTSNQIKTQHQTLGASKGAVSNIKIPEPKGTQANATKGNMMAKDPLTPSKDLWDDISVSPAALSACFPTLADLYDSLGSTSLTPTSTLSSNKSDKNSPKPSDIGEDDLLKIRIEADSWQAPELFEDTIFPVFDKTIVDDEVLGMDWEDVFGPTNAPPVVDGNRRKTAKKVDSWMSNQGFDASLFVVNL